MVTTNLKNRTIFCRDNIDILQVINSDSIDLIYLDPPFNKNKVFTAPIGTSAEGASFKDTFREEDVKNEWVQTIKEDNIELHNFLTGIKTISTNKYYLYNYCYLSYMAIRLIEMQRILKDTGSIYLHCDPTMGHYIKLLMDIIFGEKNFEREIIWYLDNISGYKSRVDNWIRDHDIIFFYSRGNKSFNKVYRDYTEKYKNKFSNIDKDGRKFMWRNKENNYKQYLDDSKGKTIGDVWQIPSVNQMSKERTGYPTQKPLALLERIIKASSSEGDIVLDPFCGCATTCIAAEKLNRQWIGIDVSHLAFDLVRERLQKEVADPENLLQYQNKIHFSTAPPKRTDTNEDTNLLKKYIYIISNSSYQNEFKVGIASNPKNRLNSYQTSDPNRGYKLEYTKYTPYFREIEKHTHTKFDNRHEWVRGNLKDIIKEIENFDIDEYNKSKGNLL